MKAIVISRERARNFLLDYHGMLGQKKLYGKEGILKYIERVGCLQYDPLNIVGRNADLVLQSKIEDYRPQMLETLLYKDRVLVDGWDKMMAIYGIKDWSRMDRIRQAHIDENIRVMKNRGTMDALAYIDQVKAVIKTEGPKFSREIELGGITKGRWSSSKFSNVALDHLFHLGELGVFSKKGTQKKYDLIENILPEDISRKVNDFSSDHDFYRWYIMRRINGVGMLWKRNGGAWLGHFLSNKKLRLQIIDELFEEGMLVAVSVEGIKDDLYMDRNHLDQLQKSWQFEKEVKFLAPLDNLIWDRDLLRKIFDFDYSWEVYIPKNKRKYGYYVLPVLYGNEIVGRFEPQKIDTPDKLIIKNWWWEEGVKVTERLKEKVIQAFESFSNYLDRGINKNDIRKML